MAFRLFSSAISVSLLFGSAALAIDADGQYWPQWRGPEATGVAPAGNPPIEWGPEANVKWKTPIPGRGSASPIVWGERVFVLTAVDTDKLPEKAVDGDRPADDAIGQTSAEEPLPEQSADERSAAESATPAKRELRDRGRRYGGRGFIGSGFGSFGHRDSGPRTIQQFNVLCIDRRTGEVIWEKTAREAAPHEGMHATNSYASGSPTTDGKRLYASFGSHGVYCYDFDGRLIWQRDLGDMETRNGFGEGASPTIHGDTLLVPWDHERDSRLFALDAATGETKWAVDRDEPTTWVTPLVVEAAGRTQAILNGTNRSRSYDIDDGEVIWECGGQATNPIATAVVCGELVYCMTGHRGSAVVAIPLDAAGDITDTDKIAWKTSQGAPYVPSPIIYDGKLYFTKGNNGVLSCLDAKTGEALIDQKRLSGVENVYASPVGANGRIYFTGRDGTTVVIPNTGELKILATNTVGEPVDASPAIAGDQLFIRGERHLFCIEE